MERKSSVFYRALIPASAVFFVTLCVNTALAAINLYGGVSRLSGASWSAGFMSQDKYITLESDPASVTKIEGMLCESKIGLSLGVNMDVDDNLVGEVARTSTYIGLGDTYLRYHKGTHAGRALWNAKAATGQKFPFEFQEEYIHVDAIWWLKKMFGGFMPGYVGLGYTSMALPAEVKTLKTQSDLTKQKFAAPFFEPRHTGKYYSFIFGFDTFASSMLFLDTMKEAELPGGFSIFFTASDRFGFGESRLSPEGLAAAREVNPGLEPVTDHFFGAYLENESSIGLRWRGHLGRFYVAAGAGYELMFYSITNFGGAAQKPGDLGFDSSPNMMRHGPIVRFYARW
ncbi:MAG: hypothetical protein CVU77_07065 [Elusimicrobia bacterium HGW-Elusimicrobia-1]|jgi:hypothetical protein|nr:MAG: hypothetical protein CVU77_07065 [Elusimicrobia bacterium HGW-Elusimicrobia-1]